jgi:hypothetical protein
MVGIMGPGAIAGITQFIIYLSTSARDFSWVDFPSATLPVNFAVAVTAVALASSIFAIGVLCEKKRLNNLILIVCAIVTVFECVVAITAFVYPLTILASVDEHWDDLAFNEARLGVEAEFECCGFGWYDSERTCGFTKSSNVETKACRPALAGSIEKYGNAIGFPMMGMAGAEIFFMLLVYSYRFVMTSDETDPQTGNENGFKTIS